MIKGLLRRWLCIPDRVVYAPEGVNPDLQYVYEKFAACFKSDAAVLDFCMLEIGHIKNRLTKLENLEAKHEKRKKR